MAFIYLPIYCSRSFNSSAHLTTLFGVLTGIVAATVEYIFGFLQYSCM